MFKRSQKEVSDSSKHWYQDKYQHILTQRNILALISVVSLGVALIAVFAVLRLAPLKTVEPYLLQVDEKTGVTQRVDPISRKDYAADESVDRYFTSVYIRTYESYNPNIWRYNYNVVRLMSTPEIFRRYRNLINASKTDGVIKRLGLNGQRDVRVRAMAYITNPTERKKGAKGEAEAETSSKIIRADITTTEILPNATEKEERWVVTITFEYRALDLSKDEQLINPLGYIVTSYQIQPETE